MVDRSLEVAGRTKGRDAYVDSWAVEKLWKVAEAIAQSSTTLLGYVPTLWPEHDSARSSDPPRLYGTLMAA